jgi:hypothetical protein
MRVQDWYMQTLEKRAAEEGVMLDYSINNEDVANAEVKANHGDQSSELKPLFANTAQVGKDESKLLRKCFPEAKKADDTMCGNPLIKVALQQAFFGGLRDTDIIKMASLDYIKVAFAGFHDELEKIAFKLPGKGAVKKLFARGSGASPMPTPPKRVPTGSVVEKIPTGGGAGTQRMSRAELDSVLANTKRRTRGPLDGINVREAVNSNPQQLGNGVFQFGKRAGLRKKAFFSNTAKAGTHFLRRTLGKAQ